MKAILEFTMPEDRVEHALALCGSDFAFALTYLDAIQRSWLKHGHKFENADDAIHACRRLVAETTQLAHDCHDL